MDTMNSAAAFFAAKLAHELDPADLAAERASGRKPLVIEERSEAGWRQGRIPGAVHVPLGDLARLAADVAPDRDAPVVVYCWGPGCNGSTKAALVLAELGYVGVRELIGGFEYWVREGLAVETDAGPTRERPDPLTAPVALAG